MPVWAVLPVKGAKGAKGRLAPALSGAEREALVRAMLDDVLTALEGSESLDGVALVSRDEEIRALAKARGHRFIAEDGDGLNPALELAAKVLMDDSVDRLLILHGDLPCLEAEDIEAMVHALEMREDMGPAVVLAPAEGDGGTNALAACPPDAIRFHFGINSFTLHVAEAEGAGIAPAVLKRPGLALDIDTVEDLLTLLQTAGKSATARYLLESGLAERLKQSPKQGDDPHGS
ncbi:MAG: 2-phospho-L-lactate guanylyltransferase [Alphaproteobacteria bacterium]|nr:2-phospho-L-lactate guanylyltransferase [Alphaproteobacteria bacterium]